MQTNIADRLVTTALSTACHNRTLAVLVLTWEPSRPPLALQDQEKYVAFKRRALKAAAKQFGVVPLLFEPPPLGGWRPPRPRRAPAGPSTASTT